MPQISPFIFLSHSGADSDAARNLKRRLLESPDARAAGLKFWFDKDDLRPGQWQPQIEQAIEKDASAFVVYVGSKGVMNWVEAEVRVALSRANADKSFLFIPALAADSAGSSALPPFAKLYHCVRDPLSDGEELAKLLKAVLKFDWDVSPKLIDEPFVGLRSMPEEEVDRFFGRTAEIAELVEKFRRRRIVAIVADSGTGKSSLAAAGFVPAFRGGVLADVARSESDDHCWHVVAMRPRANPEDGLRLGVTEAAEKLGQSPDERAGLRKRVTTADPSEIAYALQCDLPARKTATLLIVDQFEELFTATPDALAAPFVKLLLDLADTDKDFRILLTVRADYFNLLTDIKDAAGEAIRGADEKTLFERLNAEGGDAILRLKRVSEDGVRDIICRPLRLAGVSDDETALVKAVQSDISDQPSDLPLLQVALKAAWQERKTAGRSMLDAYQWVGGVRRALANEAEKAREKLSAVDQARLESVFVRLVRLGDTGGATRRTAWLEEFDDARRELLQRLGQDDYGRLVALGEKSVEIAHEALITQWPWLQRELKRDARDVRLLDRLMSKASEWSEAPAYSKKSFLAYGAEQELFGELAARRPDWLSFEDKEYVAKSMEWKAAEQRRDWLMTWSLRATVVALVCALGGVGWLYSSAQRQLDRANQALAESINADLGFETDKPLTGRQRNALWRLAAADEPVKSDYVSILARSPQETARASPGFPQISRALGLLRPSAAEAESLVAAVFGGLQSTNDDTRNAAPLVEEFKALKPRITETQAGQALDLLLKQIGLSTDPDTLQALAQALQALPGKLSEAQAGQALDPLLKQIGLTTNPDALRALDQALQALAGKLSEAQAGQALDPLLKQIGLTTDPDTLQALAQALQALPGKLSEAQAGQALDPLLKLIGLTTNPDALRALDQALQALAGKLSEAQAGQALDPLLKLIGLTTNPDALRALDQALQALAGKLSEAQAGQALDPLLKQIGLSTSFFDPNTLQALNQALQALAGKLSEAQAGQALDPLLKQIGLSTNPYTLQALAQALQALPGKLSEAQAGQALDPLLKRIGLTTNPDGLQALAHALQALAGKLSEAQAGQALDPLLKQIGLTTDPDTLQALAQALQALPGKLSEAQAGQALDPLLKQIGLTTDPDTLQALARGLWSLAGKLSEAKAGQALDPLLKQIGQTTDPDTLQALAQALQALPGKLSEAQAGQALDPLLKQIGLTTDPDTLQALARGLRSLAGKLSEAKAVQTSTAATSSLAWAAKGEEAVEWAQALVALSHQAADQDRRLAAAIAYPTAAGPATEVLLDAIRAGHTEAPAKEKGTEATLTWLAKRFPDALRPPLCPQPLQPDLKCPAQKQGSPLR